MHIRDAVRFYFGMKNEQLFAIVMIKNILNRLHIVFEIRKLGLVPNPQTYLKRKRNLDFEKYDSK